ncbi:MAG: hypothetical protein HQ530_05395 [Parcubacteria group bacterium]|nr:hypothetical protein [Parcubacteria group bacterium]
MSATEIKVLVQFSFGIGGGESAFAGSFSAGEDCVISEFHGQGYAWVLIENKGAFFLIVIDFGHSDDCGGNSVNFFPDAKKGLRIQLERVRRDIALARRDGVYDLPEPAQRLREDIQEGRRDDPLPSDPPFKVAMEEEEERRLLEALKLARESIDPK